MIKFERKVAEIRIAKNAAALIDRLAGDRTFALNLGIGIPTLIADYVQNENVYIEAENGMLGVGPLATPENEDWQLINAGRQLVTETPGCVYFSSDDSFGMIRGGHLNATALGAFSVDEEANISNWIIHGSQLGVGGAMDLVAGAENVIVAMMHCDKTGAPKLIKHYQLPVTGMHEVDYVVTEYCMMHYVNNKFLLTAIAKEITIDELRSVTEFDFDIAPDLATMLTE
jgi:3-oxoacid CoA-transferase B subunit